MNNFENYIKKAAEGYSLSENEKARMERVLAEYMSYKPRGGSPPAHASLFVWISYLHRPIAAALVMVLITSGSLSYAAESALPGDVLYTVKTIVNEPLRVAVAVNPEAKAVVQMRIAERRIEEATTLAAEGRLDEETQEELAESFESHAAAVSENIEKTAEEDAPTSLVLAERFEMRLLAHENVLAEVDVELEEDAEARLRSHRLAAAIREANERFAEKRFNARESASAATAEGASATDTAATIAATESASLMIASEAKQPGEDAAAPEVPADPEDIARAERMQIAAKKSLANAEKTLRAARSLSDEAKARAEEDIAEAKDLIAHGEQLADDSIAAFASFQESFRISERAIVYIKAAPSLEKARARSSLWRESQRSATTTDAGISLPVSLEATTTIEASASVTPAETGASEDFEEESEEPQPEAEAPSSSRFNIFQKLDISL